MFYNFIFFFFFFAKLSMDFIQLWHDNRVLSKILCSTIPIPVHDFKIKVTDFEFFCVKSLQCQLLQSFWLIWIVFGMNGYKILKCFRKEKCVSGELPCPATGLIFIWPLIFSNVETFCVFECNQCGHSVNQESYFLIWTTCIDQLQSLILNFFKLFRLYHLLLSIFDTGSNILKRLLYRG